MGVRKGGVGTNSHNALLITAYFTIFLGFTVMWLTPLVQSLDLIRGELQDSINLMLLGKASEPPLVASIIHLDKPNGLASKTQRGRGKKR